jgi:choline dehydrogenase-like flavoprotein
MSDHYDVIVIGSGAGGGTVAHTLAPTGKRILMLERGGFLPREPQNWDPRTRSAAADAARACGVPEVGPGSLTSGDRWLGMIPACRCG